jgi:hypothetical protein
MAGVVYLYVWNYEIQAKKNSSRLPGKDLMNFGEL